MFCCIILLFLLLLNELLLCQIRKLTTMLRSVGLRYLLIPSQEASLLHSALLQLQVLCGLTCLLWYCVSFPFYNILISVSVSTPCTWCCVLKVSYHTYSFVYSVLTTWLLLQDQIAERNFCCLFFYAYILSVESKFIWSIVIPFS